MNKKIVLGIIIIIGLLFISFPFILNIFIDKKELKTKHNKESFESFVLNIKMCLYDKGMNEADNEWFINNCAINNFECEKINYQNNDLLLKNCIVNKQLFSYENGEIIIN